MKVKKVTAMVLCVMIGVSALAGCGKTDGKSTEVGTQNSSSNKEIIIWTQMENEAEVLQEWANQWGEETGNKVSIVYQTTDIQQFSQAANSEDGPDGMLGIPNDQLANYVSARLASEVPSDLYDDGDFVEAAIQASYVDGKKYGVPLSVETPFLFYNTEKISEVPTTWEEMIEVSKDKGGVVFEATSVYYDLGFLRAFDSYIFNYKDGAYDTADIGMGDEGAIKAYKILQDMANTGFFATDVTYDSAKSSFQNGDAAFYIGGAWDVSGFTDAGTPFAVSDLPTLNGKDFVTPVGTYVGFVSSKSDATEEAFDFYKYVVDNALTDIYEVGNRIPATLSAQEEVGSDSEATKAQIAQVAKGEPLPTVSEMGVIWTPFSDNMKLLFSGEITAEEAAGYIDDQVKEAIELMRSGQ